MDINFSIKFSLNINIVCGWNSICSFPFFQILHLPLLFSLKFHYCILLSPGEYNVMSCLTGINEI